MLTVHQLCLHVESKWCCYELVKFKGRCSTVGDHLSKHAAGSRGVQITDKRNNTICNQSRVILFNAEQIMYEYHFFLGGGVS